MVTYKKRKREKREAHESKMQNQLKNINVNKTKCKIYTVFYIMYKVSIKTYLLSNVYKMYA